MMTRVAIKFFFLCNSVDEPDPSKKMDKTSLPVGTGTMIVLCHYIVHTGSQLYSCRIPAIGVI
jgi:hypothetical protein